MAEDFKQLTNAYALKLLLRKNLQRRYSLGFCVRYHIMQFQEIFPLRKMLKNIENKKGL